MPIQFLQNFWLLLFYSSNGSPRTTVLFGSASKEINLKYVVLQSAKNISARAILYN